MPFRKSSCTIFSLFKWDLCSLTLFSFQLITTFCTKASCKQYSIRAILLSGHRLGPDPINSKQEAYSDFPLISQMAGKIPIIFFYVLLSAIFIIWQ